MSTEVHLPSPPPPRNKISPKPSPRHASFTFQPDRPKTAPSTSYSYQPHRRAHGRSSSLTGLVSRIFPSHRPEKGHTLRELWDRTSTIEAADLVFGLPVLESAGNGKRLGGLIEETRISAISEAGNGGDGALMSGGLGKGSRFREQWGGGEGGIGGSLGRGRRERDDGVRLGWLFGGKKKEKDVEGTNASGVTGISPERVERPHSKPSFRLIARVKSPEANETTNTKAQQIFQYKKMRRTQRRSLLESGDFLGVQGANPRTGIWDLSDATSSSHPSAMSEETKRKLEQHAKDLEDKKERYKEAEAAQQTELHRVRALRENRRKERSEQRRVELRHRTRRHGKWKLNDTGWSSVAEPELSPIVQSAAGSPVRETPAADRLFRMPSALDPNPYINSSNIEQHDYFGRRKISSRFLQDRFSQDTGNPVVVPHTMSIRRKPVASSPRNQRDGSTETVIHSNNIMNTETRSPSADNTAPSIPVDLATPASEVHPVMSRSLEPPIPFLGQQPLQSDPGDKAENKAIATSSPSALTSPDENRHHLAQSLRATNHGKQPLRLDVLPPVSLKTPMQARVPSNSLSMRGPPMVIWAPPTITDNVPEPPALTTTIPTTTTIGSAHPRLLPAQLDGPSDPRNDKARNLPLRLPPQIPRPTSSRRRKTLNEPQKNKAQTPRVNIGTSSAVSLTPKQRTNRSFLEGSLGGGSPTLRNTPISTSTSPASPVNHNPAENAARQAFMRLSFPTATKKCIGQSLLPVLRRQKGEGMKEYIEREFKRAAGGRGDIGSHSRNNQVVRGVGSPQNRSITAPLPPGAGTKKGGDDSLVVWHPNPPQNNTKAGKQKGYKSKGNQEGKEASPPKEKTSSIVDVTISMLQTAWWLVEPVFGQKSDVRKRCDQRSLTWGDVYLLFVAAVFGVASLLAFLALVRVVGMVLEFGRGIVKFLMVWSGL